MIRIVRAAALASALESAPPEGVTAAELAEACGMAKTAAWAVLLDLSRSGAVTRSGRGRSCRHRAAPGADLRAALAAYRSGEGP